MHLDPTSTVGFVGAGPVGASLAEALHGAGYTVVAVSRRDRAGAERVAERSGGGLGTDRPQEVVDRSDVVFLTVTDGVIEEVAASLHFRAEQAVVHCSGVRSLSVLARARTHSARVAGFHPLQTFPRSVPPDRLEGITFGLEAEDPGLERWLAGAAAALGATTVSVTDRTRAAYHASAVMTSGLVGGLAGLAEAVWARAGLPGERALEALSPLLVSTAELIRDDGVPDALTGPFVRGDVEAVRAHLDTLGTAGPDILRMYVALALAHLPLVPERDGMEELLRSTLESL